MEESSSTRLRKQEHAVEQAYRRGYHHGLSRVREVLLRLLTEGMPAAAAMELYRVFEEQVIVPWRVDTANTSSAPPLFDVEECQRLLLFSRVPALLISVGHPLS